MADPVSQNYFPPKPDASLKAALIAVSALLLSVALLLAGNGLQGTLIPVRGNMESFGRIELGFLGTGYFIGFALGCLFGPAILSRAGHIRAFMAMASIASVVVLIHVIVIEPLIWSFLRGVTGFCFAILYVVIESWLNEKSPNEHRGAVLSTYTVINLTVITIGQLMIGLADPKEFILFAAASILVSLAALPLAFTVAETPAAVTKIAWPNIMKLYRNSPVGAGGCLAVGMANGAFWTLGPVFAQDYNLDTVMIGMFMSAVVVGGAVAQWPFGIASDRMDRRIVIIASSGLAIVAGILMTVFGQSDSGRWLLPLGALFGAGAFPIYALVVAHANDHSPPSEMIAVSSGLLLIYGLGAAVGPLIAAGMGQIANQPLLFAYTAGVHGLLVAFVVWRMRKRSIVDESERVAFQDSAVAAQTVSPLEMIDSNPNDQPPYHAETTDDGQLAPQKPATNPPK